MIFKMYTFTKLYNIQTSDNILLNILKVYIKNSFLNILSSLKKKKKKMNLA